MRDRGISFSKRIRAILKGYVLKFKKISSRCSKEGYANIVPDEKSFVEGALYDISGSDLRKLDECEGYPDDYDHARVTVQLDDGQELEAIAYIARRSKIMERLRPKMAYLNYSLGAEDILSESYHRKLQSMETLD